ncbi:MAG: hypothetical protein NZL93_05670 [Chthoniobacterales bacterium]|nr:hypothetical protein [Chthoniobacterales bacterium]
MMFVSGAIWGLVLGELTVEDVVRGKYKALPREWYFLFFGGGAMVIVNWLGVLQNRFRDGQPSWWLVMEALGQCAHPIYIGQALILP